MTIVYGNLSRYPKVVRHHLDAIYGKTAVIKAGPLKFNFCLDDEPSDIPSDYSVEVWFEPHFRTQIKYCINSNHRLIVLTSHLELEIEPIKEVLFVAYHYDDSSDASIKEQTPPLTRYVETWEFYDHSFVPELFPTKNLEEILHSNPWQRPREKGGWQRQQQKQHQQTLETTNLCVNLTNSFSAWEAYMRMLSANDVIRRSPFKNNIKEWHVALAPKIHKELTLRLLDIRNRVLTMRL